MFKKSIFCVCLLLTVTVLSFNSAFALDIGFNPSTQTVVYDNYANVEITINTSGFGLVTGYDLLLNYDPFILDIENDDISLLSILEDVTVYSSEVEVDPNSGTIHLSVLYDYCSDEVIEQPEFLTLATLNFFASLEGTSDLRFSSVTLYDDFLWPSLSLDITNPDDIELLTEIAAVGEINVSSCPPAQVPDPVPEPSTLLLFGISSLIGLGYSKGKKVS